jgi:hypothetical protein
MTVEAGKKKKITNFFQEKYTVNPVSTPTITVDFQYLSEIRKVMSSLENAKEMLSYVDKINYFILICDKIEKKIIIIIHMYTDECMYFFFN